MLVVFGANGRTGIKILEEALRRGIPVRPVVRDDRDSRALDKVIDVSEICYADADHPESLQPALQGATAVISCIDPRTAGPLGPPFGRFAGANIIKAASELDIPRIVHLSVVGAYRWSPARLNRKSFQLDREVRLLKTLPWTHIRVSCYMDELIDAHVRPPDQGRAHKVAHSSRCAPISRRDVARMVLANLDRFVPGRTLYIGGSEVFSGEELKAAIAPWTVKNPGRYSRYEPLPPGDMCVHPDTTEVMVGMQARDCLADFLDPAALPKTSTEPEPVYSRASPGRHASDQGRSLKILTNMGTDLRWVVHDQLMLDLARRGIPSDGVLLDFSKARARAKGRTAKVHKGVIAELTGIQALTEDGEIVHRGAMDFIRDTLADEFYCWWAGEGVPAAVWTALDLGVRRRMVDDPHFKDDPRVQAFRDGHEQAS